VTIAAKRVPAEEAASPEIRIQPAPAHRSQSSRNIEAVSMKLYATDNSELMNITSIRTEGRNLVINGTIMGAMPIRAVVKPAEARRALRLMSPRTMIAALLMMVRGSR
jgi:hypothetical protein